MKSKSVGPFTVHELNVEEGLGLVSLASEGNKEFQTALLLATVKCNGEPINNRSFKELMPHFSAVVEAAMELNGFLKDK